jgi:glucose/arabinose dehydrogenase/PKD repeat protein
MPSSSLWSRSTLSLPLTLALGAGLLVSAHAGSHPSDGRLAEVPEGAALLLPEGFTQESVVSDLQVPTAFASLPDGRLLIAEKAGVVRLFKNGALQPTPFIDLRSRINNYQDRGLLGLAVDPDFATNGHVYLLYTYENDATDFTGPKTGRLARYTATGDTASPGSELVLLGTVVGASCNLFPSGADCIPSDSTSHTVGNVRFAPDGTLFVTLGDGARFDVVDDDALRAQDLDSLAGKVVRITRTGQGLPFNPFWNGDAGANRSKLWSYGLRNPYRFNLRPGTDIPYLGDVGWSDIEEINVATAGANFGWPCYEGHDREPGYELKELCQQLYSQGPDAVKMPLYFWGHDVGQTATGGAFYTGTSYPEPYQGVYFFGDYGSGWIRSLRVDQNDNLIPGSVTTFATGLPGLVGIDLGPDTLLHYVDIQAGELRRFRYVGSNRPPTAVATASPREGYPPLSVRFSSSGSHDPDGDPLQYSWDFGDGSPGSNLEAPEHTYATAGLYTARLTVSDGNGGTHSATVRISVGNLSPVPSITSPSGSSQFKVGDVVSFSGGATDPEDGELPASGLSWTITLHHCSEGECHAHPHSTSTGASGAFTVGEHGDLVFFELTLTATDSQGLKSSTAVTIHPQTVRVTLETFPPGRTVVLDGRSGTAPLTRTVIAGSTHTVYAPSPQSGYHFQGWSDEGAPEHTITVGASSAGYTASFAMEECPAGQYRAEYFNNLDLSGWPDLVRCEQAPLDHSWGDGSPGPEINPEAFSARWTGRFFFFPGRYTFSATVDDGVHLFVDGSLLIDAWWDQAATTYRASRWLSYGEHTVVMEYYENGGPDVARLSWRLRL